MGWHCAYTITKQMTIFILFSNIIYYSRTATIYWVENQKQQTKPNSTLMGLRVTFVKTIEYFLLLVAMPAEKLVNTPPVCFKYESVVQW